MNEKLFAGDLARLRIPEPVARLEVARVVDLCLEGVGAQNVLDVSMGTGLFAEAFAQRGLAVGGVDSNPAMIEAVRTYVPTGAFERAPAEALPYPGVALDLVFMGLVLHDCRPRRSSNSLQRRLGRCCWRSPLGRGSCSLRQPFNRWRQPPVRKLRPALGSGPAFYSWAI
jgi:SAM-dependent methyltransferase